MRRHSVLTAGAQMRQSVLSVYQYYPPDHAMEIIRRMAFDLGQAVGDIQGHKEAALLLYAAADAITTKMPIEDFRLPTVAVAAPAPAAATAAAGSTWSNRARRVARALLKFFTDRFWIGFVLGLIARGQP